MKSRGDRLEHRAVVDERGTRGRSFTFTGLLGREELGGHDQHQATLQWERPCGDMGLDTALEGKEPGCGSGWRDRPGTEGTTVGQPTQGRERCFIGLEAAGYPASRHGDFPLRRGVMFIARRALLS